MTLTVNRHLFEMRRQLEAKGVESAALVAKLLMMHALETDQAGLIGAGERILTGKQAELLSSFSARALTEPVYRIIGSREFHGLRLTLHRDTLEPRDDTEALVELVLEQIGPDKDTALKFADLGTGTGAIALALLSDLPNAQAVMTDIAAGALETALENARQLGLAGRITGLVGSWFEPLDGQFDFIVSNPPYIASNELAKLSPQVRDHDPLLALDGGEDGLDAYRALVQGAASHLKEGGFLALEIGFDQKASVMELAGSEGWACVGLRQDLGGHYRALVFSR